MGIAAILLGPNPLKWKQTSPIFLLPHVVLPPLLTKPIKFSASTINYERACSKFNVKLKCFFSDSAEEKSHLSCSSSSFSHFSSFSSSSSPPPLGRVGGTFPWPSGVEPLPEREFIGGFIFSLALALLAVYLKSYWWSPFCGFLAFWLAKTSYDDAKTSVVKLQVGLLGTGRTLQRNLNQIAQTANTSTVKGLSYVLTGSMNIAYQFFSIFSIILFSYILDLTRERWAVEVLWTPQNETSTLLEEQLLKTYPLLKHF